jgi:acyl-ACP thioesterase
MKQKFENYVITILEVNVKRFMKLNEKKRTHRIHRRTQNFFCHNRPISFLFFSVCSVGF